MAYNGIQNKALISSALKVAAGACELLRDDIDTFGVQYNQELDARVREIIRALNSTLWLGNSEPRE